MPQKSPKKSAPSGKLPLWPFFILLAGLMAVALVLYLDPGVQPRSSQQSSGTALIGGPFELVDQTGNPYTDANLKGHYSIIYFGYTFCPDVCPTELQSMTQALDLLPKSERAKIQPIFITVDPERDTVDKMAEYVKLFDPTLIGLTGTPDQVAKAMKAYRVYATKAYQDGSKTDYLMDHSSIMYVMGPDGKYAAHFGYGVAPEKIAAKLKQILG